MRIPHPVTCTCRNIRRSSRKVSLLLFDLNQNWSVPQNFSKIPLYKMLLKSEFSSCYMQRKSRQADIGKLTGTLLQRLNPNVPVKFDKPFPKQMLRTDTSLVPTNPGKSTTYT
jgi:hypothetical protein